MQHSGQLLRSTGCLLHVLTKLNLALACLPVRCAEIFLDALAEELVAAHVLRFQQQQMQQQALMQQRAAAQAQPQAQAQQAAAAQQQTPGEADAAQQPGQPASSKDA